VAQKLLKDLRELISEDRAKITALQDGALDTVRVSLFVIAMIPLGLAVRQVERFTVY
jgi:hypothetical protein